MLHIPLFYDAKETVNTIDFNTDLCVIYNQFKLEPASRSKPARALSEDERLAVCDMLNSKRFVDSAPRQVYAALLDEETYLCSWRTMYRILNEFPD